MIEEFFKEDNANPSSFHALNEQNRNDIILNKNEVVKIKMFEYYIRNAEPESGVLTRNTKITIENKDIHYISRLKIAIFKV